MKKQEVKKLKTGLYKIYWKSGGVSLSSVGCKENGDKWIAPTNWINVGVTNYWKKIKKVELIK